MSASKFLPLTASMMLWMLASMAFLAVCRFGSSLRIGVGLEVITTDPNELL